MYTVRRIHAIRCHGLEPGRERASPNTLSSDHDEVELNRHQSLLAPTTTSSSPEPHRPNDHTAAPLSASDARLGSPSSIPSSPTFIRSSSSAILERDLELLLPPSPSHSVNPLNAHRIPPARGTTQLESSSPIVFDSAAAALTHVNTAVDAAFERPAHPSAGFHEDTIGHVMLGSTHVDLGIDAHPLLLIWVVGRGTVGKREGVSGTTGFGSTPTPRSSQDSSSRDPRSSVDSDPPALVPSVFIRLSRVRLGYGVVFRLLSGHEFVGEVGEWGVGEWDGAGGSTGWCGKDEAGGRRRYRGRGDSCESLASWLGDCWFYAVR
ncbi:hypothetical protein D9611_010670 [Ephemerocybe angulata]|uniref:Uncharacterized protein n=1 Tax=Ephemerocybe angulata TaxID=980116 RepID=A0A8H5F1M8_9AGAR|nr:hypothetical protein D9611_010670 [Tulosesus angulatus]